MTILFVSGINDLSKMGVTLDDSGKLGFLMDGNCSVHRRLDLGERPVAAFTLFGKGVKQRGVEFKPPPALIFNQIADADTHRGALERCGELCSQIRASVINHPSNVLATTRDQVAHTLRGIPGVRVPQTQRFQPRSPDEVFAFADEAGFAAPFIVRVVGLHGGVSMLRISNRDDYASLHALPFDGRDFYLTEFVDYRSGDGNYRKTRFAVVDGVPLIRHHLIDREWKVHAASLEYMDQNRALAHEQNSLLADFDRTLKPQLAARVSEIAHRLGLDYFGIDCHLDARGEMLVFEANANMNILYNSRREYDECLGVIKRCLLQLIDARAASAQREAR